jgi:hypothetical protein
VRSQAGPREAPLPLAVAAAPWPPTIQTSDPPSRRRRRRRRHRLHLLRPTVSVADHRRRSCSAALEGGNRLAALLVRLCAKTLDLDLVLERRIGANYEGARCFPASYFSHRTVLTSTCGVAHYSFLFTWNLAHYFFLERLSPLLL